MKKFDVWMMKKDEEHEVLNNVTMEEICKHFGISRQAVYNSIQCGALIKDTYSVQYTEPSLFIDYFDAKQYNLDIYDSATDSRHPSFCGGVLLTKKGYEMFKDILESEIEVIKGGLIVKTDKSALLNRFMYYLAGYVSIELYNELFFDCVTNDELQSIVIEPSRVTVKNEQLGKMHAYSTHELYIRP